MRHQDQTIVNGIIEGNQRILNRFYKENIRYIQGYILGNCGNAEDVEDIFQDALVVLYQKLKSGLLEIRVPLTTYFYGICKNLWRNRLRKKTRWIMHSDLRFFDHEVDNTIIDDIQNSAREDLCKKYFQNLSSDSRKVLNLVFEGKSMKEISEITGYSENYSRKKKFLAKEQLLNMMKKDPIYDELRAVC